MQVINSGSVVTNIAQPSRSFNTGLDIDLSITDESSNVITAVSLAATYVNGVLGFSYDFTAVEGVFYYVIVSQSNSELVKFKIFCTDQTDLQDYLITDGDFIGAPQGNDEIISV